ncbi:MAG: aryl-sulfate sulfotransferase [Lachnospiraceae bacterium]|nr:aryl-sulfate sulfotransferase [Lachnospiraceae bacterium]
MGFFDNYFIEVKNGSKVTYSESDLNKLDRMYESEVLAKKNKKIISPMRKEMQRSFHSQVRDYAFERILDRHLYTFKYLLVIPDPYGAAKQTALILFNSSKTCQVHYCVEGDTPEYNFEGDSVPGTRHRVAIMGLYQGRNNKVDLKLIDEENHVIKHRIINIYVPPVADRLKSIVCRTDKQMSHFPFILLNGINFNPIVIDGEGKIRYSLQCRTGRLGMIPLQNGRFLLADKTANRMNSFGKVQPCRYHEMDYMGRVYRTFLLEYSIGRAVAQYGNSLFLVTSSDKNHISDCIIELDMDSGKIINKCDISTVLSDKYRTIRNWADITRIEYHEGMMYVTVKKLHCILKLDWSKRKLKWVISPPLAWKGTFVEKYLLKGAGLNGAICMCPDYMTVPGICSGEYDIILFDTRSASRVKTGHKPFNSSVAKVIHINEEEGTYSLKDRIKLEKSRKYGSAFYSGDSKYMLVAEGILKDKKLKYKACIAEADASNSEITKRTEFSKIFLSTWEFKPCTEDYCQALEINRDAIAGSLTPPAEFEGQLPPLADERIDREYFGRARLCDSLFLFAMMPGMAERIYFIGENNKYVQEYQGIEPAERKMFFAITLENLRPDEYFVYVESEGMAYKLRNEIRITGKKDKKG